MRLTGRDHQTNPLGQMVQSLAGDRRRPQSHLQTSFLATFPRGCTVLRLQLLCDERVDYGSYRVARVGLAGLCNQSRRVSDTEQCHSQVR
jgi:hypothetical protein